MLRETFNSSDLSLLAIVTDEKGPNAGDNYTVLLWNEGQAYKTHSFHVMNAYATARDWCFNTHGGVYADPNKPNFY
jgi:hypothetical protein